MKKLAPFLIVAAIMTSAVFVLQSFKIKGVPVTGTEVTLSDFTSISMEVPFDVYFTQGPLVAAKVEGEQTVTDKLEFLQKGNSLTIKLKDKSKSYNKNEVKIYLTAPELESVSLAGSGNFYTVGNVTNKKSIDFAIAGSGNIEAIVDAPKIDIDIAGSGEAEINGKSEKVYVSLAGSGDYEGNALIADEVDIDIAGSGDAFVYADKKIDASIAGSGDVYYSGKPEQVTADVAGSGNVRPHKE